MLYLYNAEGNMNHGKICHLYYINETENWIIYTSVGYAKHNNFLTSKIRQNEFLKMFEKSKK